MTNKLGSSNPNRIPQSIKEKKLDLLEEIREYYRLGALLVNQGMLFSKGISIEQGELIKQLFEDYRSCIRRICDKCDDESRKRFRKTLRIESDMDFKKTFEEQFNEFPTIYAVVEDLRKYIGRGGNKQRHLVVQVNGNQFKIKEPIHQFLKFAYNYKGDFHYKDCLDKCYYEYDDFPTYQQGMKSLFKSTKEKELRDLVLDKVDKGMYRCKIDMFY